MERNNKNAPGDNAKDLAPDTGRFWVFVQSRKFGLAAALFSLVAVLLFVFVFTPYQDFLYSDMRAFWMRAINRLNGETFRDSQFIAWPPMYHILLAELFGFFRAVGLEHLIRIETPLTINIVAHAVSVYALQRLAAQWFDRPVFTLLTVLLYGIGFPALYFNAFLLAENLGGPLLVVAMALVACKTGRGGIIAGAALFSLATIIRPSVGPYGLAFVALYLAHHGLNMRFIVRAAIFTAVFFTGVILASMEVSRISGGRVNGLSANGGLDFFIANSDYHRVDLSYDGWHFFVIVPAQSWKPENGVFYTTVPFYQQDHYFHLGWEAIKRNPMRVAYNVSEIRNLFFADMLPSRYDVPGFATFRPIWDWFKFLMFVPLGLFFWTRRELGSRMPTFVLLASIIGVTMVVSFIFTGEPRYTYAIIHVFYLLFFKLVEQMWGRIGYWSRAIATYAAWLLLFSCLAFAFVRAAKPVYPPSVEISFEPRSPQLEKQEFVAGRVLFPFNRKDIALLHGDDPTISINQPGIVRQRTKMEVLGNQTLRVYFRTYSSWSFALTVDGQLLVSAMTPDYFRDSEGVVDLAPGVHDVELMVEYSPLQGGVAVNYSYDEPDGEWRIRRQMGVDSDKVRFHPVTPKESRR